MYSNLYNYYNICDYDFSTEHDYAIIVKTILENNGLKQKAQNLFENQNDFPWIDIGITYTRDGNYTIDNTKVDKINLITIVVLKKIDQLIYTNVLLGIAKKLSWKLFLEEDDDGNENIEIE
ncbi:hypothetical protein AGMMS50230_22260 [Spirochaetia bacterium]|nr:hypothetical protein AGMMS50230_22260 [Spirochaetia bacterium]